MTDAAQRRQELRRICDDALRTVQPGAVWALIDRVLRDLSTTPACAHWTKFGTHCLDHDAPRIARCEKALP